ncbi:Sporulation initiation phosphotransferase F [Planctomycetes bacterium Pan216]|uniref:Sporulation initiation phosphotransferase F n=1 Tax=Kolteria novifilia TaxID=2527975 RepID=A0A518B3A9_9BACT|nr:Sporulation initiation phosphotransferase F [Planctomycetes bacterium Pan216]
MTPNRKLLVVDDDMAVAQTIARYLRYADVDVTVLTDPLKAMDLVQSEGFPLALLDIQMPGMTGIELLREIKAYDGSIKVIMMTGYATLGNLTDARQAGADDILTKPILDMDFLSTLVDQAYDRIARWESVIGKARSFEPSV